MVPRSIKIVCLGAARPTLDLPDTIAAWGPKARLADVTWEAPILAQVGGLQLDNATIAGVVASTGSTQRPVAIDRARLERQMRALALEHVAGGIGDAAYLARIAQLRGQIASFDDAANAGVQADAPWPGLGRSARPGSTPTS